jgi:hypothetical protein
LYLCSFCFWKMETQKKKRIDASNQQAQVGVKDVVALA